MSEEDVTSDATDARDSTPASRATPGSLYVVATPLGNARDLTMRALDILRTVDLIAAEDTRTTLPLLRRYGIETKAVSLHAHNEARRASSILASLALKKSVAIVSDAGTPAISDPGARLVRAAHDAGFVVVPIPGPSAVAAAVSAAGLDAERFVFVGFLPPKAKARRDLLASVASLPFALVIYEAPHRVRETVAELGTSLGPRTLVVARELTKIFETLTRLPLEDAPAWFDADSNRSRGEFVLIVDAASEAPQPKATLPHDAERLLTALLDELPPARAAHVVATVTGAPRDQLYARAVALKARLER
ncbi:MAG TPA: 16S rRNA (cytidine(1402)-2'-O)-methyltransferase [Casimicrobiaceae bacterium]|jgi:16S rRNA (cytidine1402-2'-O)-methyltransferase